MGRISNLSVGIGSDVAYAVAKQGKKSTRETQSNPAHTGEWQQINLFSASNFCVPYLTYEKVLILSNFEHRQTIQMGYDD